MLCYFQVCRWECDARKKRWFYTYAQKSLNFWKFEISLLLSSSPHAEETFCHGQPGLSFFANFGPVAPGTLRKFRPPTLLECSSSLRVLWITFQLHRRAHVQENVKITLPLTDITLASFTAYAPPAHICFPLPSSLAETLRLPLMSVDVSSERREPPRLACRRYFPPAVNALRRLSAPS